MKTLFVATILGLAAIQAQATIIQFDLQGLAGFGLRSGNETTAVSTTPNPVGSGGEINLGISYDDVSNLLTLNTGWGTANGFFNLSGNASAGHLHGPTTGSGVAAFNQTASVKYGLDTLTGWSASASSGGFNGTVTILEADEPALLAGRFYMNVHTSQNGGGEIRGNLVQSVPEPGTVCLLGVGTLALAVRRRRG
ncbi:MAG: CHRD domain-containing protein [Chthoniobacteraceae bacterium]